MSSKRSHIVRRQVIALQVSTEREGQACISQLRSGMESLLLQSLERALAAYDPDDGQSLHLERLHIDLGDLPLADLKQALPALIEDKVHKAVAKAVQQAQLPESLQGRDAAGEKAVVQPTATRSTDAWAYFLREGVWPWWYKPAEAPVEATLEMRLVTLHAANGDTNLQACLRFIQQLGEAEVANVWKAFGLEGVFPALEDFWRGVTQNQAVPPGIRKGTLAAIFLQAILQNRLHVDSLYFDSFHAAVVGTWVAELARELPVLRAAWEDEVSWETRDPLIDPVLYEQVRQQIRLLEKRLAAGHLPTRLPPTKPAASNKPVRPLSAKDAEPYYIENAGLVLLHPFLQPLFEGLGLVEGDAFVDEAAACYATLLLHHLAYGEKPKDETALVLNKVLCGLDPSHFVDTSIDVPIEHLAELHGLLEAVCEHWKELRNAHPDDLRTTFLQRDGKLHWGNHRPQLVVNRTTIDLIVDRLPWAISLLRLPWMAAMLEVAW